MRCTGKKIMISARYCLKKNCNFLRHTWDQVFLQHHDLFTMSQLWLSQMTSWSLQVHQWSAPCMHHDLCRSTNNQHSDASWSLQKHQQSAPCMHSDSCRSTNGQHPAALWFWQEHQRSTSRCIMIFAGAPTVSVLMHCDFCRSTNSQHLACIVFTKAPRAGVSNVSWCSQEDLGLTILN